MIKSAGATHTGMRREHNEDCYGIDDENRVWLLADGLGGHARGEVASELAREVIHGAVKNGANLNDAVQCAHEAIRQHAESEPACRGMGTTVVVATIKSGEYEIAWIGDSRAYLYDGELRQLTKDHSLVQTLVDRGVISSTEALTHPGRNVITQSAGDQGVAILDVGFIAGELHPGDLLLLCSDGLTTELSDAEIASELGADYSLQDRVNRLVTRALAAGGRDNVTALLVEYSGPEDEKTDGGRPRASDPDPRRKFGGRGSGYLVLLAVILIVVILTLAHCFGVTILHASVAAPMRVLNITGRICRTYHRKSL